VGKFWAVYRRQRGLGKKFFSKYIKIYKANKMMKKILKTVQKCGHGCFGRFKNILFSKSI